jgi:hypothetical protein
VRVYFSRRRDYRTRTAAAVALAFVSGTVAVAATLSPPASVVSQLGSVKLVSKFAELPAPIRAGDFTVDGVSAKGWEMAEPGGAFSATDVPVPNAPGRRLIFAACDPALCLIHYERGGIAHFYQILALSDTSHGWKAVWSARGPHPVANLDALRALLQGRVSSDGWSQQWVKGDF